jgi:hypothetical protein
MSGQNYGSVEDIKKSMQELYDYAQWAEEHPDEAKKQLLDYWEKEEKQKTGAETMNNGQLKQLDKLEAEAAQLAASFFARALKAEPGSDAANRFKRLADKANIRAERRYQASITAYRASKWHKPD